MDRFIECWNGLDDPRTGNAALHDFHEILAIACARFCAAGKARSTWAFSRSRRSRSCAGFSGLRMAFPAMTRSAGFSACSIRSSSGRRSGSWLVSPSNAKGLWRSTARFCAARSTAPVASRRCTWSPPGLRATPCAGADRHRREVERNYRRAETAGDAAAERNDRDCRRAQASAPSPSRSSIRAATMPSP